jgi:hypothetical protein
MGLVMTLEVVAFGWSWSSVQPGYAALWTAMFRVRPSAFARRLNGPVSGGPTFAVLVVPNLV